MSRWLSPQRLAALILAIAAASLVGYGVAYAYAAGRSEVRVHQVDKSPEQIRDYWTPENVEKAKQGDPMPVVTDR
ncbi:hypothetical protein [Actinoplanes sp. NPDC049316]|uniref:hypothetical protein n=1 Tax=Actinoplanes sp. NPDC049316 TaxID=3154727 RepID=UPI003413C1F1